MAVILRYGCRDYFQFSALPWLHLLQIESENIMIGLGLLVIILVLTLMAAQLPPPPGHL